MSDAMHNIAAGPESPAWRAVVITASANDLATVPTRALYIGGTGGDVTVTMAGGGSVQFTGVPAGAILPLRVDKMTATTASQVIALY